jgi:trehalose/maltose hydrolase-like predicted phosphorylase
MASIGARALTGDDYRGHVFWDTEIFLLPFFALTWPEAARSLLMYRFHTLDGARAKAAGMGWRGALFAWESADTGAETTPEQAIGPDRQEATLEAGEPMELVVSGQPHELRRDRSLQVSTERVNGSKARYPAHGERRRKV